MGNDALRRFEEDGGTSSLGQEVEERRSIWDEKIVRGRSKVCSGDLCGLFLYFLFLYQVLVMDQGMSSGN